ncbi:MAG: uncharacterized protein QG657_1725 [Acidobacteriota bacterium]|nr:uncharacterized protein [Acidobacteriota bacterium]
MEIKNKIPFDIDMLNKFFRNQPVTKAYIFGSYVRGDYSINSDVDFLVELEKHVDLFRFIEIKLQLEALLQKSVDLVSARGISERIKPTIDSEKVLIYEKYIDGQRQVVSHP